MRLIVILVLLSGCVASSRPLTLEQELARERKLQELLSEATLTMRENKLSRSYGALSLAQELNPNDARVLDGLGCLAYRQNKIVLAESLFKKSIESNPKYDRPYSHLALIAQKKGDYKGAVELFRITLSLNPLNYRARNNLAILLFEIGLDEEARREILRAAANGRGNEKAIQENIQMIP